MTHDGSNVRARPERTTLALGSGRCDAKRHCFCWSSNLKTGIITSPLSVTAVTPALLETDGLTDGKSYLPMTGL